MGAMDSTLDQILWDAKAAKDRRDLATAIAKYEEAALVARTAYGIEQRGRTGRARYFRDLYTSCTNIAEELQQEQLAEEEMEEPVEDPGVHRKYTKRTPDGRMLKVTEMDEGETGKRKEEAEIARIRALPDPPTHLPRARPKLVALRL